MIRIRFLIVYLLVLAAALFIHQKRDYFIPEVQPLASIAMRHGDWTMLNQNIFSEGILAVLRPSDYLSRTYVDKKGNRVELYLGYHSGESGTSGIHSPKNCLPGGGWYQVSEDVRTLSLEGNLIPIFSAVYQKGDAKMLFLYWFQVGGKKLTNEYALKLTEIKNSILYNRKDTAFIRISVLIDGSIDKAFALGEKFISDFYLEFDAVLPN